MNDADLENPIGKTFGSITVIGLNKRKHWNGPSYKLRCVCGVEFSGGRMLLRTHKSCGCLRGKYVSEGNVEHGHCPKTQPSKEYVSWAAMKSRCCNPTAANYRWYGALGIKVCDRWLHSFDNFFADMGNRPEGKTLERVDGKKGYYPDNCKWGTDKEQANNRSSCRMIAHNGITLSVAMWADTVGVNAHAFRARLRKHTLADALAMPDKTRKKPTVLC